MKTLITTIIAIVMLASTTFAQTPAPPATIEIPWSPYAGDMLGEAAKGQDCFFLIRFKCGSGCGDMALLLVNYDGVKIICPSLRDALQLKEFYYEAMAGYTLIGGTSPTASFT
jgi:hypothetical protein